MFLITLKIIGKTEYKTWKAGEDDGNFNDSL